jgi:HEPN domain-containing protein
MIDVEKQIKYWADTGKDDLATALYLFEGKRYIHCLFFCHLSIEKIIKAHVTKHTKEIPEKSHNLNKLLLKTNISLDNTQKELLGLLMIYQLEGRYPENYPQRPTMEICFTYFTRTKELFEWLRTML